LVTPETLATRFSTIISTLSACTSHLDETDRDLLARARRHQLPGPVKDVDPPPISDT
jgi:hypothetical protein